MPLITHHIINYHHENRYFIAARDSNLSVIIERVRLILLSSIKIKDSLKLRGQKITEQTAK